MTKTIRNTTIGVLGVATILGTTLVYRSIGITPEAKAKVVQYSKILKLTQRNTATKMILEWQLLESPFKGYPLKAEYPTMICWMNQTEYDSYLDSKAKIAQGITVYEVIAGERCINK